MHVVAFDLDVDRRRLPEIENLRHHVGGQEIEHLGRELGVQFGAQVAHIIGGRAVAFLQRHHDVGVGRTDQAVGRIHGVEAAIGQADDVDDVVEIGLRHLGADILLDQIGDARGFLGAGAGLGAHMQDELPAVGGREEVVAEERRQAEHQDADAQENRNEDLAALHQVGQHALISAAQLLEPLLEAALEIGEGIAGRLGIVIVGLEQEIGHRRHQRARQDVGGDHGEYHRLGQRHEQIFGDAAQQEHRHEDDADAHRGHQGRHRDLCRALEDGVAQAVPLLQIAFHVLDRDGGVVDENTHGESEPAQGHDVEGLADQAQRDDRGQDRQRDRHGDDQGRAPGAEEQQDHHRRQRRGDDGLADHATYRGGHEHRLVRDRLDAEFRRQGLDRARQGLADARHDVERRGGAGLDHGHQHAALAVLAFDVGLRREAVRHRGDVAQIDGGVAHLLDRQVVQLLDGARRGIQRHVIFELADLGGARGLHDILAAQRGQHVVRRQILRLHQLGVDIHHHLALLAAIGIGNHRAGHADQLGAQEIEAEIVEARLGQSLARQAELEHGQRGRAVIDDLRRLRAGRHLAQDELRGRGDLGVGGVQAGVRLQEDLDHGAAVIGGRFDMFDIVDERRQCALIGGGQTAFELFGIEAGIGEIDRDDRNVDIGKQIGRGAKHHDRAEDQDQERQHHEGVGAIQGKLDNPHSRIDPCAGFPPAPVLGFGISQRLFALKLESCFRPPSLRKLNEMQRGEDHNLCTSRPGDKIEFM